MNEVRDLHSRTKGVIAFAPVDLASDTTTAGAIIDRDGFEALEILVFSGVLTDGAYELVIEDGDVANLSDAAVVASTFLLGVFTDLALTDDATIERIGYIGHKRYVRISVITTGTTTSGFLAGAALLGSAKHAPVADQ